MVCYYLRVAPGHETCASSSPPPCIACTERARQDQPILHPVAVKDDGLTVISDPRECAEFESVRPLPVARAAADCEQQPDIRPRLWRRRARHLGHPRLFLARRIPADRGAQRAHPDLWLPDEALAGPAAAAGRRPAGLRARRAETQQGASWPRGPLRHSNVRRSVRARSSSSHTASAA